MGQSPPEVRIFGATEGMRKGHKREAPSGPEIQIVNGYGSRVSAKCFILLVKLKVMHERNTHVHGSWDVKSKKRWRSGIENEGCRIMRWRKFEKMCYLKYPKLVRVITAYLNKIWEQIFQGRWRAREKNIGQEPMPEKCRTMTKRGLCLVYKSG